MNDQRNAGWPNQPGQGPPGQPPGRPPGTPPGAPPGAPPGQASYPPYGQPPGASYGPPPSGATPYGSPPQPSPQPPPQAPPQAPPGAGSPYSQPPPPGYGTPSQYGQPPPPGYGAPPGGAPPQGYRPPQPYPPQAPPQAPYGQPPYPGVPVPQAVPAPKKRSPWLIVGIVIGALVVVGIVAGVIYEATLTPAVTSLEFAHNFQDNKAVGITNTFTSNDPEFFAIVKLNTTKGHPNVKVVWTVVNAIDATKRTVTAQTFGDVEKDATSKLLYASVSRGSSTWPVGQYKADVFLDGKLAKTAQFTVTA